MRKRIVYFRKRLNWIIIIIIAVFIGLGIVKQTGDKWNDDNTVFLNDSLYGFKHNIKSYLLIGTDESGNENYKGKDYRGNLSDFILLLVIDQTDKTYGFLQIDRNTIVDVSLIDHSGRFVDYAKEQICTAHWYGINREQSALNTVNTVKRYLGELERIDGYYVLNMNQIAILNESVDGIHLRIEDDLTPVNPVFQKGVDITLTNEQAIQFVEARFTLADDKNTSRMNRHKAFMEAFIHQAFAKMKDNPIYALNLWYSLKEEAVTDISLVNLYHIINALKKYKDRGVFTVEGETRLGTILGDGKEHEEFYPDPNALRDTMKELYSLELIE